MFSFHKPKIYRSNNGCCICRAKSSSSRFTDSTKYEDEFQKCFRIQEKRCGEICNACVLLVKRWKKLPDGTNRHWNHVVDARAGPGTKSTHKIKKQLSPTMQKYKSPLKAKHRSTSSSFQSQQHQPSFSSIPSPLPEELSGCEDSLDKSDLFSQQLSDSEESDMETSQGSSLSHIRLNPPQKSLEHQISPFLDLTYWKMTQVCCGTIFKGMHGEVLVDPQLFKPCWSCNKPAKKKKNPELKRSTSLDDTDSNSSTPSFNVPDFYDTNTPEPETPPDSPPNSPKVTSENNNLTCSSDKINFVSGHSIPLES